MDIGATRRLWVLVTSLLVCGGLLSSFVAPASATTRKAPRTGTALGVQAGEQPAPVQAPYYAGWEQSALPPSSLPWAKLTHVLHFSVLPTASGGLDDVTNGVTADKAASLVDEAHSRGRKVLVSVGGTPGSEDWPSAASESNRARFVSNLVAFMSDRRYDGIDLNWEGAVDEDDYLATIRALRAALDSRGRGELLTAVYFGSWSTLASTTAPFLDWVTMMSYLPYGQPASSDNSPIYGTSYARIDNLVSLWLRAGVPATKIVFGFAAYASVWSNDKLVTPEMPYRDAVARGYSTQLTYDPVTQASSLRSGTAFVSMENDASVRSKIAYRHARGLRGVVVWELGAGRVGDSVPLLASLPTAPSAQTTALTAAVPAPTTSAAPVAAMSTPVLGVWTPRWL